MSFARCAVGAIAIVVSAALVAPAHATFFGEAKSTSGGIGGNIVTQTSTNPTFGLTTDWNSIRGNHAYSELNADFGAGIITGRNHACVGPTSPGSNDGATGSSQIINQNAEILTIVSDTLPVGTDVTVLLCFNMSSQMSGSANERALVTGGSSTTGFLLYINGFLQTAVHKTDKFWENPTGSGHFAGMNEETVSASIIGYSITKKVGQNFSLITEVRSSTSAGATYQPGAFPTSSGSAGFAMTFGIMSVTAGAHVEWNGSPWVGSCLPSAPLIPDNPVPAPGGAIALLAGAPALLRRRR